MSAKGQKRKGSQRAYSVRITPQKRTSLKSALATIPKRSTTILTNSRHRPWKGNGFGTAFNRAKIGAAMADRDLHFHDLRGTAATRFYIADVGG